MTIASATDPPGPLSRLAIDNPDHLPVALLTGRQGSGKTTLAQRLTAAGTWAAATDRSSANTAPVHIVPGAAADAVLREALAAPGPHWEHPWLRHWLRALAVELDATFPADADPMEAMKHLGRSTTGMFIVDALESFIGTADDQAVQTMISVLLLDVTDYVRYYPRRPFGMIVFIRPDTVQWAVPQYSGRLLDHYRAYTLD